MSSFFQYAMNRTLYNSIRSISSSTSSRQINAKGQLKKDSKLLLESSEQLDQASILLDKGNKQLQDAGEQLEQASILLDKDAKQLNIDEELLKKAATEITEDQKHILTLEHCLYYALTGKVKKGVTLSNEEIELMEKAFKDIKEEVKDEPFVKITKDS